MRKNQKSIAVEVLNIALRTALAKTGSFSMGVIQLAREMYCQKKMIQMIAENRLKTTCAKASCLFPVFPPKEAMTEVAVVPMLAPITIATEAGKLIIPLARAVKVRTLVVLLDCITSVTMTHKRPNHHNDIDA